MEYLINHESYILNLIDTPGHVDFSYEVSRSLAACEGAILLIDATQGVQAQTLAHHQQAKKLGLFIIPVINKIDILTADIPGTKKQISEILGLDSDSILLISAKTGQGVQELLQAVINRIPPPGGNPGSPLRALDGQIRGHDQLLLMGTGAKSPALEVGVFSPHRRPVPLLQAGEVGYVVTSLKDLSLLTVGDTISTKPVSVLPGYSAVKPVVFISLYPTDGSQINLLRSSLDRLRLQDSSLQYTPEFSPALGNGFRVGLLGLLHADIVQERLEREFDLELIAAAPSVSYKILTGAMSPLVISKAMDLPDPSVIHEIREPVVSLSIFAPGEFLGRVIRLCQEHRGTAGDIRYLGQLVHLTYLMPLAEMIREFYDRLKSVSQGYATMDYELLGFFPADLVRLDILVAGDRGDAPGCNWQSRSRQGGH